MTRDFASFRARSREVSAQSWATIRGTMVRDSDGHYEPWLKVFVGLGGVGNVMDRQCGVLPVFQQPLCSLENLRVAIALDIGELWLYDRRLRRVIPVPGWQGCPAVLVGPKQLAPVHGDDASGRVAAVLLSLPDGDGKAWAEACLTLDPLHVQPVVEPSQVGNGWC